MGRRAIKSLAVVSIAFLAMAACYGCAASSIEEAEKPDEMRLEVKDEPYVWVLDYTQDMQLPELPTGCEATAASTLMRMNGVYVTKFQVADAMPKSDDDFVNAFIGDPYSYSGWACSAPCVTRTINGFLDVEEKYAAVELTGTPLLELPTPCVVWATIDMVEPQEPRRVQDGYGLYANSHCVVLKEIKDDQVYLIDPLGGDPVYDVSFFEPIYDGMGRQAVYMTDIGTAVRMISERGVG